MVCCRLLAGCFVWIADAAAAVDLAAGVRFGSVVVGQILVLRQAMRER